MEKQCVICGQCFFDLSFVTGGRRRLYCTPRCRRGAEQRRRRERTAERHNKFLASLPEPVRQLYEEAARGTERLLASLPDANFDDVLTTNELDKRHRERTDD